MVQAILSGIAGGLAAARTVPPEGRPDWKRCAMFAALAAVPGVLLLSILDWLIGPW